MPKTVPDSATSLVLPNLITGRVELGNVERELELLNNQFDQATYHQQSTSPRYSKTLSSLLEANSLDLAQADQRKELYQTVRQLKADAPQLHISFATEPDPASLSRLVNWLRQEIHPQLLLHVGLQPNITAGCIVRTTNKVYDFSLREYLLQKRPELVALLGVEREPN